MWLSRNPEGYGERSKFALAFLDLGEVCLETRDYPPAVAALRRALELSRIRRRAPAVGLWLLLAQGYTEEAIPHLRRVNAQEAFGIAQMIQDNTRRQSQT